MTPASKTDRCQKIQFSIDWQPGSHRLFVVRPMALRPYFSVSLPLLILHFMSKLCRICLDFTMDSTNSQGFSGTIALFIENIRYN